MYESMKNSLNAWNDTTSDRNKLQHMYIAVALSLLVIAGVLGLLNQNLGQQILGIAIAAAAIFLVNAITWALLQSFVLFRLKERPMVEIKSVDTKPANKAVTKKARKITR